MRVLHCVPSMAGGGAERQLTYLAREHVRAGLDVHVAVIHSGPNSGRLAATGATIHWITASGNHDPRILLRLWQTIRVVQPDVVQCWLPQMQVAGGTAASMCGTPWVFSERAAPEAYPPGFKMWLRVKIAAWASAIVSNSSAGDRYWKERCDARVERYIIPNGLPLDEIAAAPVADLDAEAVADGPFILTAGRLESEKNIDILVGAIRLVSETRPVQALFCGSGSLRDRLVHLIDEARLRDRVRIEGYVENLWSVMKRADVLVSASIFEGSPNVVLEAMACECPLVVSDIPGHRELLDDDTAMFVRRTRPREVADAIEAVLRDPAGARARARRAQTRVQRYSSAAVARQYAEIYDDVSRRARDARIPTS